MIKEIECKSKEFINFKRLNNLIAKRYTFDENMSKVNWSLVRKASNVSEKLPLLKPGSIYKLRKFDNVNCEEIIPFNKNNDDIILFIHGGGFVTGSAKLSRNFCAYIGENLKSRVISVDYTLAPDEMAPKQADQVLRVYMRLINLYPNSDIIISGVSAGGNLALVTALRAIKNHLKVPKCLILYSPLLDVLGKTKKINIIDDEIVRPTVYKGLKDIYAGNYDKNSIIINSLKYLNKNMPPIVSVIGEEETFYSENMYLYDYYMNNNMNMLLIKLKDSYHASAELGNLTKETKEVMNYIKNYVSKI